jgi:hypothetical protein
MAVSVSDADMIALLYFLGPRFVLREMLVIVGLDVSLRRRSLSRGKRVIPGKRVSPLGTPTLYFLYTNPIKFIKPIMLI